MDKVDLNTLIGSKNTRKRTNKELQFDEIYIRRRRENPTRTEVRTNKRVGKQ